MPEFTLLRSERPVFPSRCVACGKPDPKAAFRLSTNSTAAPACPPCARSLRYERWLRRAAKYLGVTAGLAVSTFLLPGGQNALVAATLAIGGALPTILYEHAHPRVFDVTARQNVIDYEFKDSSYANEFAALNGLLT